MSRGGEKQVSFSDTKEEAIRVVKGVEGHILLDVHRNGNVQRLESNWFNFYISPGRTVVEAFFGKDTGGLVPAVMLLGKKALQDRSYEIKSPFDDPQAVGAIFGQGRPGGVAGDEWGTGKLIISDVSPAPSAQYIEGSFEFTYTDREGVKVRVVAEKFWAKNNG
ncbi:hypothetical protein [Pseudomonas sp. GM74]|uniref:hypothetical protein n=1 Tax=Pseudomonas sp. GM74 TaxID=1144336 RepID=UPI000518E46C|nr:hypothetical protein [Pseudomonas sp. GM74]